MDRLLSEQDCQRIFFEVYGKEECELEAIHTFISAIATAQLSKTDKEWVEWVVANAEVEGDTIILPGKLWRERRKEIGL
jgi:hypothetical protein